MIQPYGISGSPRLFNGDHRDCCDKVGVSEVVNGLAMGSPCVLYFIPVFFSRPECRVSSSDIYGNHKASCSNPGVFSEVL